MHHLPMATASGTRIGLVPAGSATVLPICRVSSNYAFVPGLRKGYYSMSSNQQGNPEQNQPRPNEPGSFTQEVQASQVTARVPEKVGRGVFSTGAMVFQ